jgi:glyoxylase-like metal-dependent hydrolase (beta-lactamase superfamily II)
MKPQEWFWIKEVEKGIFLIKERFYRGHANLYFVKGRGKNLLIDTGTGIIDIKPVLPVHAELMVVNTHAHYDHCGGNWSFKEIYIHKNEKEAAMHPTKINTLSTHMKEKFFTGKPFHNFKVSNYKIRPHKNIKTISDGEVINLGNRKFIVIHTPGHSPGSICLYDDESNILFSGDTVYKEDPFFNFPPFSTKKFVESLKTLSKLEIRTVFPGHYEILNEKGFSEAAKRIYSELKLLNKNPKIIHKLPQKPPNLPCLEYIFPQ